jgi:hypothetical protein
MTIQPSSVANTATDEAQPPAQWNPRPQTPREPIALTSWDAPPWANYSAHDDDCVIHRRNIGELRPTDDDAPFIVDVVLRDQLIVNGGSTSVTRTPAQISVSGHMVNAQEARDLAHLLNAASDVLEHGEPVTVHRQPKARPALSAELTLEKPGP